MATSPVFGKLSVEPADLCEAARLDALQDLDALDDPRDETLDRIARLIVRIFGVKQAVVSLIDFHRQWYMAAEGVAAQEVDRKETFCRFTLEGASPLVVRDASLDPRFAENPHVTAQDGVRFYAGVPLRTRDGQNVGTVCAIGNRPRTFTAAEELILVDLTQIAMDFIDMKRQATMDGLTGILNRRAFREEAGRAITHGDRHREELAMLSLDLDHFKAINDSYGHKAGDEVLVAVSAAVRAQLRSGDIFGRIGGEEFSVLLPKTDREGAEAVAEKLREAIAGLRFDFAGTQVGISASFGLARTSLLTRDLDTLMAHADAALYRSKAGGRNRNTVWEPVPGTSLSPRRRVLKSGQILFNERRSVVDCTIRSLGEDGARLDVISTLSVPETFTLLIHAEGYETRCRVVSRDEQHLEVTFLA